MMANNNGSGMDMYDIIENNVFAMIAGGTFTGGTGGALFTFEVGHTYKVILKCRKSVPTGVNFYAYKTNANEPNVMIGNIPVGESMKEYTYTHSADSNYLYIGAYAPNQNSIRTATYNLIAYVEDIT